MGSNTDLSRSKQTLNLHLGAARNDAPQTPPPTQGDTTVWTALISPLASLAGTYLNGRVEKAKAETEAKVATAAAKATVMRKVAAGEMDWNQTWAEGAQSSWKDEWLTILVSIPLILAFTGYEDVVARGFDALNAMPDYYKTAVGVVFAASFGIQSVTKMFKK